MNDITNTFDPQDIEKNKTMAILATFIFFIPLLTEAKTSPFARFYANLGLIELILYIIPLGITQLLGFIIWIIAIVHAAQGKAVEIPGISKIKIIK